MGPETALRQCAERRSRGELVGSFGGTEAPVAFLGDAKGDQRLELEAGRLRVEPEPAGVLRCRGGIRKRLDQAELNGARDHRGGAALLDWVGELDHLTALVIARRWRRCKFVSANAHSRSLGPGNASSHRRARE
jgi:hypothetical protein